MGTRQDIAAALTGVAGLTGHSARPASVNALDAWPQWRGAVRAVNGYASEHTWAIIIVLPQGDDITADGFVDDHGQAIAEALRHDLSVDGFEPATIDTGAGQMYALLVTGRSE